MASQYKAGQQFVLKSGKKVTVVKVERRIHGNSSKIYLKGLSDDPIALPVVYYTGALTKAIAEKIV